MIRTRPSPPKYRDKARLKAFQKSSASWRYHRGKTLSIDGQVCSIGSANLDIRSFSINYEISGVIYDTQLARELEAKFEHDRQACSPFRLDEYARRSALIRLQDSTARLLSPLL